MEYEHSQDRKQEKQRELSEKALIFLSLCARPGTTGAFLKRAIPAAAAPKTTIKGLVPDPKRIDAAGATTKSLPPLKVVFPKE
jgi:hypothetical protein